jgi:Protein of unknown function (DUF3892)
MSITLQVRCIERIDHENHWERIQSIGGVYITGKRWKFSESDAIASIESLEKKFIVDVDGKSVDVIVAKHEGRKYLKTKKDSETENNLLSLPDCED